jgi:hypothetical protein
VEGVGHDIDVGFGKGDEFFFKKGIGWHDESPFPGNSYQSL